MPASRNVPRRFGTRMARTVSLALVLGEPVVAPLALAAQTVPALRPYRWKQRVVVVLSPPPGSPDTALYQHQRRELAAASADLATRDVIVLDVPGDASHAARQREFRRQLRVADGTFAVVLVGKDGGVKLRQDRLLRRSAVLTIVDAMPMGADEARRRGTGTP